MAITRQPVNMTVDSSYSRNTWKYLKTLLDDQQVRIKINEMIGKAINPHVPRKSGALQDSMEIFPDRIVWGRGLPYAQYQYGGQVYGPNYPIMRNGIIVGWFSRKGVKKHPTGRELGVPGEWRGWKFGYTTPGTAHHWIDVYQWNLRSKTNKEITNFLKRECKARGLST